MKIGLNKSKHRTMSFYPWVKRKRERGAPHIWARGWEGKRFSTTLNEFDDPSNRFLR
jgi:hypothetical protein